LSTLYCRFVASANLHEGAYVANYPFDGYLDHSHKLTGKRHPAPDDKAFQYFAKLYAKKHSFMAASKVSSS
jgi:carboxypeptidase D